MSQGLFASGSPKGRLASVSYARLIAVAAAAVLAGCSGSMVPGPTSSVFPTSDDSPAQRAAPPPTKPAQGPQALLARAAGLVKAGRREEALTVLASTPADPNTPIGRQVLTRRGLLLLELGRPLEAEPALKAALDPARPDWRIISGLGTAAASLGRQKEAQERYREALALAPNHPSLLNNLALSNVLDRNTKEGERLLRQASKAAPAAPRLKENLAIVAGLKGGREAPPADVRDDGEPQRVTEVPRKDGAAKKLAATAD